MSYYNYFNERYFALPTSGLSKLNKANKSAFKENFKRFKDTPIPSREGVLVKGYKRPALKFRGGGTPIKTEPLPKIQPLPKRLSSHNTNIKKSYNNLTSQQDKRISKLLSEYKSINSRSLI